MLQHSAGWARLPAGNVLGLGGSDGHSRAQEQSRGRDSCCPFAAALCHQAPPGAESAICSITPTFKAILIACTGIPPALIRATSSAFGDKQREPPERARSAVAGLQPRLTESAAWGTAAEPFPVPTPAPNPKIPTSYSAQSPERVLLNLALIPFFQLMPWALVFAFADSVLPRGAVLSLTISKNYIWQMWSSSSWLWTPLEELDGHSGGKEMENLRKKSTLTEKNIPVRIFVSHISGIPQSFRQHIFIHEEKKPRRKINLKKKFQSHTTGTDIYK